MFTIFKIFVASLAIVLTSTVRADLAIISHAGYQGGEVDRFDIKRLFLGKRRAFPDGHRAYPIHHATSSPDRREFFDTVLGMSESSHKRHWSRMVATGRGTFPDQANSYAEVMQWVATTPGSIGYVDPKVVDDSVKVLLTIKDIEY